MQTPCEHWLGKLANFNAARTEARGIAPPEPSRKRATRSKKVALHRRGSTPKDRESSAKVWTACFSLTHTFASLWHALSARERYPPTGYRLDTETTSIVQAAHIHQHAVSGNDDPRNGLALTPDAHWMFDAGLWTVIPKGDDLLVHVAAGCFSESSPHGRLFSQFHGQHLHFHDHARIRPAKEHFASHQKRHRIA